MYEYFSLRVSKDRMRAYLTVLYDNLTVVVTAEHIIDYLEFKGVVFGICKEDIIRAVDKKQMISNLLVAKGIGLREDTNKHIVYNKDLIYSLVPRTDNEGFVNFPLMKEPVYVRKGDLICSIKMPSDKLSGTDIYGHEFYLSEENFIPKLGAGVQYSRDDKKVYAAIDGCVDYEKNIIDVIPVHILKNGTESRNYIGSVVIYSKIEENIKLKCSENIIICGSVRNVSIEAGGNVVIHGSLYTDSKHFIKAGKSIVCRDISNYNLYCGGSIYSTRLIQCIAKAGRSIMVNGTGEIVSGRYTVGETVYANVLGNPESKSMMINIWENWYSVENNTTDDEKMALVQLEDDLAELRDQYMQLGISLDSLKNIGYAKGINPKRANIMRRITLMRAQIMHSIVENKNKYEQTLEKVRRKRMEIACSGEIFRGVQFRIGQAAYTVPDNTKNRRFYLNGENVFLYKQYKQ